MTNTPAIPAPEPVERAVRAFWEEALRAPLSPAEETALTALDRWMREGERPHAVLHGPRTSRRAAALAHFVDARRRDGTYETCLVPMGPDIRLERDIIALLAARLMPDYAGGAVRALVRSLAWDCLGEGREEDRPPLLLAFADLEEAEPFVRWSQLFSSLKPGVRVLATVEGDAGAARACIEQLGLDPARTLLHELPPQPEPIWNALAARLAQKDTVTTHLLVLLACALGRLRADDLVWSLGSPLERLLPDIGPFVIETDGYYALRRGAFRSEIEMSLDAGARSTCVGNLLSLPSSGYRCDYERAHLEQSGAPLAAFVPLVTPDHLGRWLTRPHQILGFVADLERVRSNAALALAQGPEPEALALAVRSALTEASLNRIASRSDCAEAPVGVEGVDLETPIADHRDQARAIIALGSAITTGPLRREVLALAEDAARRIADRSWLAQLLFDLAGAHEGATREKLARDAVEAYRAAPDAAVGLFLVLPLFPPEDGVALAHEAFDLLQATGQDPGEAAYFVGDVPRPVAEALWLRAEALPLPARARVLAALAKGLGDPARVHAAFDIAVTWLEGDDYDPRKHQPIEALAPFLDQRQARAAAQLVVKLGSTGQSACAALALRLAGLGEPVDDLLSVLPIDTRLGVLARTLPVAPDPARLRKQLIEALMAAEPALRFGLFFQVAAALATAGDAGALVSIIDTFEEPSRFAPLTFLARHDPEPARAQILARRALELGLRLPPEEAPRLLELVPLATHLPREGAAQVLAVLLDEVAAEYRSAALAGDGVSLVRLVPLIAALEGERGLAGAAREVTRVAAWFP